MSVVGIRMKLSPALLSLVCLAAVSGCAKLDAPEAGDYRAALTLQGGEAVLPLHIDRSGRNIQLNLKLGDHSLAASEVRVQDGQLSAVLPDHLGELQAKIRSNGLSGEWRIADAQGKSAVLPFDAKLHATYRFEEKSLTDNADVSGFWNLNAAALHVGDAASPALQLAQTHDAVDGTLLLPNNEHGIVFGQVHGDDVYFTVVGAGQVTLMKGKVNSHGDLEGKLWANSNEAQSWSAKRSEDEPAAAALFESNDDTTRRVAFPWPIPTK